MEQAVGRTWQFRPYSEGQFIAPAPSLITHYCSRHRPTTAFCLMSCPANSNLCTLRSISTSAGQYTYAPIASPLRLEALRAPPQPPPSPSLRRQPAMFPTFTGNSRRPRNVNLSGSVGNPFANTSWSPSNVSGTAKTIFDAQADREKRQAERQRLKAALRIQQTWRGHRARSRLADHRRAAFDNLYASPADTDWLHQAFTLLLSFCRPARPDDLERLLRFANDAVNVEFGNFCPQQTHWTRLRRLVEIIVSALHSASKRGYGTIFISVCLLDCSNQPPSTLSDELRVLLRLATRIVESIPEALRTSSEVYFSTLASICQQVEGVGWLEDVFKSLSIALDVDAIVYMYFASNFLTKENITLFETNIDRFASLIDFTRLGHGIRSIYALNQPISSTQDELLWLLAHSIHLIRTQIHTTAVIGPIRVIFLQLAGLSSDFSARVTPKALSTGSGDFSDSTQQSSIHPYLSRQFLWLISSESTSKILQDFTTTTTQPSVDALESTSLLAGYLMTLLQSFPDNADDRYLRVYHQSVDTVEDQEWRVIILFLDLYTFILRLSDDEDFFSGIYPSPLRNDSSLSRIQSCSLSFEDVKFLTLFLKNIAFTLYYTAPEVSPAQQEPQHVVQSRLGSYLGAGSSKEPEPNPATALKLKSSKLEFFSLREIISNAMTMLYERDSRKPFLPSGHWLVTDRLQNEDFVSAVIAEEQRQYDEVSSDSDDDADMEDEDDFSVNHTFAGQRVSRHARVERLRAKQKRLQRERRLAELGPKLAVLKHMPFAVPFDTRVKIFRQFIELDIGRRDNPISTFPVFAKHTAQIRRGQLFEDAFEELYKVGDGLKDPIQITFVDQFNQTEAGIDGGGVTKEFLTSVISEAFGGNEGMISMFTSSPSGLLYPNPIAIDTTKEMMREGKLDESSREWHRIIREQLKRYEFLGRMLGKCIYEGILVDLSFAGFFLLQWPSSGSDEKNHYKGSINDLRDMDEELYAGMLRLKNHPGDVSELGIDFTVTDQVSMPGAPIKTVTKLLVANGDQVYVTNDNRPLYMSYMARHRLVVQPALQTAAFLHGLRSIIRPSWLSMFNQTELQHLVGGDSSEIDIDDLRRNTVCSGLYEMGDDKKEHPTIRMFWKVLRSFTDAQRRDLLKYVSSTPRAPLLGFSQLRPLFSIRDAGDDEERLPSASTCVNLLKLPRYRREETLRSKLLYAITSGAGFDLS
ncbi:IQ and HECT domain protein [Cordyceps militaris CM01]|uniref:HECT-type E3 ubiquitin transferase n=1 Tax=Cordyceps militaris (strain CM01) TaxID=983644 RepID=G3JGA6_CORMM|nr:IQ and HECT domain protein [Cordyceps militaris CM01]EGX93236.1 IQ and HECT domain protein [Cordyceps militaris CM01]